MQMLKLIEEPDGEVGDDQPDVDDRIRDIADELRR